jgi:tRNA(Ile)-lysidine synthase
MEKRFAHSLKALVGDPQAHTYLLAVSGGADSSVMAHLFHRLEIPFTIAHCNFHLRGEDSDRDMELVKQLARKLDAPILIREFDTLAIQKNSGNSVEMTARQLRYDWFAQAGAAYDYIVTAHHADDAAETMLLNLCRGTGLKGLTAIPERNGKIIRPLLPFSAQEIRNYAHQHNIHYAVDITNADETIRRNRIRNAVMPILKELNPSLTETLSRNRKILCRQYAFYRRQMDAAKAQATKQKNGICLIERSVLDRCPDRVLLLSEILADFGFHAEVAEKLCAGTIPTGRIFKSDTHTLLVDRAAFLIGNTDAPMLEFVEIPSEKALFSCFSVEKIHNSGNISFDRNNDVLYLDADKVAFPLVLRTWQPGDSFIPLGCKGRQKVSDYLTDHKFDRFSKQSVKVLCAGNDIVWIVGCRSDERYKLNPKTTKCYYKISIK